MFQDGWKKTISSASRTSATGAAHPVPALRTDRALLSHALRQAGANGRPCGRVSFLFLSQRQRSTRRLNNPGGEHQPTSFLRRQKLTDADFTSGQVKSGREARTQVSQGTTGFLPFPVNNFKHFLTLFSKFFSSFPHGTCSLSVSRQYLALDELYHPFSAALPSNTTLGTHVVRDASRVEDGILTLYDTLFQRIYTRRNTDSTSLGYNSDGRETARFSV